MNRNRRLAPYLLLGVLTVATGLAAGLAVSETSAKPSALTTSLPHSSVRTYVDPRHDPAGLKFSSCDLVPSRSELLAFGTFSEPFPYSGGAIYVFPFSPEPGLSGSAGRWVYTTKGALTWQFAMHLNKGPKPTLCEVAVYAPSKQ